MNFQLTVLDAQREIYKGQAEKITITSTDGEMTVLSKHMPMVTPLGIGEVSFTSEKGEKIIVTIGKGILSVDKNNVTLLVEDTKYSEEISEDKAIEAQNRALELIKKGVQGIELTRAITSLRRSLVDIKIIRRSRKKVVL